MATLTRWDPFREMMTLRGSMDRMFDDSLRTMRMSTQDNDVSAFSLAVDVSEDENAGRRLYLSEKHPKTSWKSPSRTTY